jgi:ribosomal-protein-alanine N-acetyltransferase
MPPASVPPPGLPLPGASPVEVVPMRRSHLRQVLRIDAAESGERWSLGLFLAELRRGDGSRCYLVAQRDGSVVGFAGMLYAADDGHVTTVATDPRHRRTGVATALLVGLATDARRRGARAMTLEVRASNDAALGLYRRFGFAPAGVRKAYYGDNGEDALVLWAEDIDSPAYAERLARLDAASLGAGGADVVHARGGNGS